MEINNEVIAKVVAMNIGAAVHDALTAIGEGVKHVGNHISDRLGELKEIDPDNLTPADKADILRFNHWLNTCSRVMDTVTLGIQVNDVGYNSVVIPDDEFDEYELESIKALAMATPELTQVMELIARNKRESKSDMEEALKALLTGDPWEAPTNGN